MKDNFSIQSTEYAKFRPGYPDVLFEWLFAQCQGFETAWDCATGNGQIAVKLAERFSRVEATDISENQLKNALQNPRVHYSLQPAEAPTFENIAFDLIVVGQAAHWFHFDPFYAQVRRALKPGGLLALVGYNLIKIDPLVDAVINRLYVNVLGVHWDAERRHVDAAYATIPFPFEEIPFPEMSMSYTWTRAHLIGYLGTWSAVQHFIKENGRTPIDGTFLNDLAEIWPENVEKTVRFPIFGKTGRVL